MEQHNRVFSVTTEKNTFNHIECVEHLMQVRRTVNDWTPTKIVFEFVSGQGWVKSSKNQMPEGWFVNE